MILVAGDSFTDRYTWGQVTRLSPDAPVPVVMVSREERREGGAANVAATARALGADVMLFESSSGPIVKHRILGRGQHVVRVDYDRVLSSIDSEAFEEVVDGADVCVFVDYGKGSLSNVKKLIEISGKFPIWTLVDPKGHDWRRYAGVDVIKPNRDEMREMIGGWSSEDELLRKVNALQDEARIGAVLLTLGEQGMMLIEPGKLTVVEPRWVNAVCHSGAGEASIAALAVALSEGFDMTAAAQFAARAGEAACTRFGTTVVTRDEVFNVERVDPGPSTLTFAR